MLVFDLPGTHMCVRGEEMMDLDLQPGRMGTVTVRSKMVLNAGAKKNR